MVVGTRRADCQHPPLIQSCSTCFAAVNIVVVWSDIGATRATGIELLAKEIRDGDKLFRYVHYLPAEVAKRRSLAAR